MTRRDTIHGEFGLVDAALKAINEALSKEKEDDSKKNERRIRQSPRDVSPRTTDGQLARVSGRKPGSARERRSSDSETV